MKPTMRQTRDGGVEFVDEAASAAAASASLSDLRKRWRWRPAQRWYVRTLCWVWMAKGLFNWAIILGAYPPHVDFMSLPASRRAMVAAFACLDLLTAVGLWLTASWGAALWFLCAGVEAAALVSAGAQAGGPLFGAGPAAVNFSRAIINLALIAGYGFIAWRAGRERD